MAKTFEQMVNKRLIWFLESNRLITDCQCSFYGKRSTTVLLIQLETFIKEAFIKKEHINAIFFFISKEHMIVHEGME